MNCKNIVSPKCEKNKEGVKHKVHGMSTYRISEKHVKEKSKITIYLNMRSKIGHNKKEKNNL